MCKNVRGQWRGETNMLNIGRGISQNSVIMKTFLHFLLLLFSQTALNLKSY